MQIPPAALSAITLHSLLAWFWALGWAAFVFLAILGYGAILLRALRLKATPLLSTLAGIGVSIFLGGCLNYLHHITVPTLIAFVAIGIIAAVALVRKEINQIPIAPTAHTPFSKTLILATIAVFAFRIAGSVHDCQLQDSDDFNYYLAAPIKMLQTHSFAGDVFSERRVMSSIGGNQFLGTLILATQPAECLQMADWMLGLFLLVMLAFALGKEFDLTPQQQSLLAFLIAITPQLRFNLTFVVLPSAIFMGLVYLAAHRKLSEHNPTAQALLIGATIGAVSSMKSSYVVHGALFLLCIAVLRWHKRGLPTAIRFALFASLAGIVVMLPWMIANGATAGTWFYPLLGKGFQYSAYGHYPPPTNPALGIFLRKVLPFCIPLFALLAAELYWGKRDERTLTITALMATALVGSLANGLATGGDSVRRYNYPCILPAITLAYIVFARRKNLNPHILKLRVIEFAAGLFALATAINTGTTIFTSEYKDSWRGLEASLTDYRATTAATRTRYAAIEQALPTDAAALTSVLDPFLFDFRSHNILIADWPGAASPKPGWPLWEDSDSLARFLQANHVRYLIYGYNDCNLDPKFPDCHTQLDHIQTERRTNPHLTQWIREEAAVGYDARHQFEHLAQTRHHLYDDGQTYILDLSTPH